MSTAAAPHDDLLDAALAALNQDPTASMAAIAEACGISRATLHRRFAAREDLLVAVGERGLVAWESAIEASGIQAAIESGESEALSAALRDLLSRYVQDVAVHGFTLTDPYIQRVPHLAERAKALTEHETRMMAAAQEAGLLRRDLPAVWLGWSLFGTLVAARDAVDTDSLGRRGLDDLVWATFMNGASA